MNPGGSSRKWLLHLSSLKARPQTWQIFPTSRDPQGKDTEQVSCMTYMSYLQIFSLALFCPRSVSWMESYFIHRSAKRNYKFHESKDFVFSLVCLVYLVCLVIL